MLARITPLCLKAASKDVSRPASAPVWDEAALTPALVIPDFKMMSGFFLDTRLAISTNFFPSLTPSMYPRITFVFSSSARACMISSSEISALFPILINFENPTSSERARSRTAIPSAPD